MQAGQQGQYLIFIGALEQTPVVFLTGSGLFFPIM